MIFLFITTINNFFNIMTSTVFERNLKNIFLHTPFEQLLTFSCVYFKIFSFIYQYQNTKLFSTLIVFLKCAVNFLILPACSFDSEVQRFIQYLAILLPNFEIFSRPILFFSYLFHTAISGVHICSDFIKQNFLAISEYFILN